MSTVDTHDGAFLSLSRAKSYLNITVGNEHDQAIVDIVNGVSMRVEQIVGRRIVVRAAVVWTNDGKGRASLRLPDYPTRVSAIRTRAGLGEAWAALDASTDYEVDGETGTIFLASGTFPEGPRTVEVTHAPGFGEKDDVLEDPRCSDIVQLAMDFIRFAYSRWSTGLIATASASMGGQSVSIVPEPPKDILDGLMRRQKRRL